MNLRANVLRNIIEHGPGTRDELATRCEMERRNVAQICYQLQQSEVLVPLGDSSKTECQFDITDKGREYYEKNKDKKRAAKPKKEVAPPPAQQDAFTPNISASAHSLADQISVVLAENSELRNTLVEIRRTINRLLGDNTIVKEDGNQSGGDHIGTE